MQENIITSSNIPLLRILDALRLIKEIPATSPDECVTNICKAIEVLSQEEKQELAELSLAYTPYVRALLGAIYENMELDTQVISSTLNGVTSYKLPISDKVLSNLHDGGKLALCHRPEQMAAVFAALCAVGLEPKRVALVRKDEHSKPWLFLVEAQKGRKPGIRWEEDVLTGNGVRYGR